MPAATEASLFGIVLPALSFLVTIVRVEDHPLNVFCPSLIEGEIPITVRSKFVYSCLLQFSTSVNSILHACSAFVSLRHSARRSVVVESLIEVLFKLVGCLQRGRMAHLPAFTNM